MINDILLRNCILATGRFSTALGRVWFLDILGSCIGFRKGMIAFVCILLGSGRCTYHHTYHILAWFLTECISHTTSMRGPGVYFSGSGCVSLKKLKLSRWWCKCNYFFIPIKRPLYEPCRPSRLIIVKPSSSDSGLVIDNVWIISKAYSSFNILVRIEVPKCGFYQTECRQGKTNGAPWNGEVGWA
jgi:hypothetical protein